MSCVDVNLCGFTVHSCGVILIYIEDIMRGIILGWTNCDVPNGLAVIGYPLAI